MGASLSIYDQNKIDELLISLDGTDNKSKLGANSILAASMLFVRASALRKVSKWYE
jgi:enolase